MVNMPSFDLEGPLALAVQAAWKEELVPSQVDAMAERVRQAVQQKRAIAYRTLPKKMRAEVLGWLTLAASLLLGVFCLGRMTAPPTKVVVYGFQGAKTPEESASPLGIYSSHFAFTSRMVLQAVKNLANEDPSDLLLFGKGPQGSIALGQGFPLNLPKSEEAFIHVFEPRVSPRSRVLRKHAVTGAFAVSPDGKWIVTQSGWQIEVETEDASQLAGDWSQVERVQFVGLDRLVLTRVRTNADGKDAKSVQVFRYPELQSLKEMEGLEPEGAIAILDRPAVLGASVGLIDSSDQKLRVYDTHADKTVAELKTVLQGNVRAIAISADQKWIATAGGESAVLLHAFATGELQQKLANENQPPSLGAARAIAFSPDGKYLAAGEVQNLVIYEVATGKLVKVFPSSSGGADEIVWSQDGKQLTTVHGSYIQSEPGRADESVYPHVAQWRMETK